MILVYDEIDPYFFFLDAILVHDTSPYYNYEVIDSVYEICGSCAQQYIRSPRLLL